MTASRAVSPLPAPADTAVLARTDPALITATVHQVTQRSGRRIASLALDEGEIEAVQAVSCLVAPLPGDRVLLTRDEAGLAYILAVLDRPSGQPAILDVPGASQLSLQAPEAQISADRLTVRACDGAFLIGRLRLIGQSLKQLFGRIDARAVSIHRDAALLDDRAKTATRRVEGIDHARAGARVDQVDGPASARAHTAVHSARKDMRLDGERINLG
ncbi:MAG: DUF3540 domain-containing protein [Rhodothalassiaceae bacterium]